jgi:hypothetical protein
VALGVDRGDAGAGCRKHRRGDRLYGRPRLMALSPPAALERGGDRPALTDPPSRYPGFRPNTHNLLPCFCYYPRSFLRPGVACWAMPTFG